MSAVDDAYRRGYQDGLNAYKQSQAERIARARIRLEADGGHWGRPLRMTAEERSRALELRSKGHSIRNVARLMRVPRSTIARAIAPPPPLPARG